mmetsp:Transcript_28226/g.53745  ORF Transcript_28226/g.53745 Transcript_28226/m.53745 type:complete len:755 (+) Transcript_28226:320-2584(+)
MDFAFAEDGERACKICYEDEEDEESGRLVTPCSCRGSARHVHLSCLKRWHAHEGYPAELQCKTCGAEYAGTVAVELARMNLENAVGELGWRNVLVGVSLHRLALLLVKEGCFDDAEQLYRQSLEIHSKICGLVHPRVANDLTLLAQLFRLRGQDSKAEPLLKRALNIRKSTLGSSHPDVADCLTSLADLVDVQGRHDKAMDLYRKAMVVWEHTLGPNAAPLATTLLALGQLHVRLEQPSWAAPMFERVAAIRGRRHGPDHDATLEAREWLATANCARGHHEVAAAALEEVVRVREAAMGPGGPAVCVTLCQLARVRCEQGRHAEALDLCNRVASASSSWNMVTSRDEAEDPATHRCCTESSASGGRRSFSFEGSLSVNNMRVASLLSRRADVLRRCGRVRAAELAYMHALSITESARGPNHPEVAEVLKDLARLLEERARGGGGGEDQNNIKDEANDDAGKDAASLQAAAAVAAEELRQRAGDSATAEAADQGQGDRDSANVEAATSISLRQDDLARCSEIRGRIVSICEMQMGCDHPKVAEALDDVAGLLVLQGKEEAALPLYQRSLSIRETAYGLEHKNIVDSLNKLAELLQSQGRLEEAQALTERARDIMSDRCPSPQKKEPVAAYPTSSKPSSLAQLHLPEALQKLPSTLSLQSEEGEVNEGPMEAISQGLSRNFNSPVQGHHVVFDAPPGMLRPAANQPHSHSSNTRTRTRFATPSQGVSTTNDSQRSGNAPSQQSQPGRMRLFCCFGG